MRSLVRNRTKFWYVYPSSTVDVYDNDGFLTGEKDTIYSTPEEVYITTYPSNGAIIEQIFGKDSGIDLLAVSCEFDLRKDAFLFNDEPNMYLDLFTTHDFTISAKKQSLNGFQYGLKGRT